MPQPVSRTTPNIPYQDPTKDPNAPVTPTPTGNGSLRDVMGTYNLNHPDQVIKQFMQQHGIDPNINTGLGSFVQGIMAKIVPVLMRNLYDSGGQQSLDQAANPTAMLNSVFGTGTGNLGGNLKNFANTTLAQVQGDPAMGNLNPDVMGRMLTDLNAMQTYGMNPYQSTARQDQLDKTLSNYETGNMQQLSGTGPGNGMSLWNYILKSAPGVIGR